VEDARRPPFGETLLAQVFPRFSFHSCGPRPAALTAFRLHRFINVGDSTAWVVACFFLGVLAAHPAGAQQAGVSAVPESAQWPVDPEAIPRPEMIAVEASGPITVDGVLDEAAWAAAVPATGFVQSTPATGSPATERTEVRVLYDGETLYIGAMLYDSDPSGIVAQQMIQDFYSPNEDVFGVSLDTFLDRRNAYYLMTNANGAIRDAQAYDNSRTSNAEWEGILRVEASVHDEGWSVELAVPFKTLRFDPSRGEQVWGINFLRRIRRKNEDSLWAPVARRTRLHRMAEAGTLTGLPQLESGRNVTVKPFVLGEHLAGALPDAADLGYSGDGGVDVKWGITPRMTADLTWRTDFSQVEADQEQVNLDRFPLFFPEKREFFIENSGTYQFGDLAERNYRLGASPRDFTLFNSRRIGLDGGRPIPIVAGARVTGRAVGFEVGALNMQTEETDALAPENFTVARARRTFFDALDVGGIFINRQATSGPSAYNRSWGVDANAHLFSNLILHSYYADVSDSEAGGLPPDPGDETPVGDSRAIRLSAAWRDAITNASVLYRRIGDQFEPDVGFVRRKAIEHYYGTVGIHPQLNAAAINEVNPYIEAEQFLDLAGLLETRNLVGGLAVAFLDGGSFTAEAKDRYERLDEDFDLSGGTVPAGRYGFREGSLSYMSNAARSVSGELRVGGGGYFQGDRRSFGGNVVWRPSRHIGFDLGADHNVIDLTGDPFTVDVYSARIDYSYSTKFLTGAWVQYNDATGELVTNVRVNFIHSPLSDLFLVYSERRDLEPSDNGVSDLLLDRRITIKLTKLFAF
jgi:hypothetical protein